MATAGDCHFDEEAALHALSFFSECLTFTKAEWQGKPFILAGWQRSVVAHFFGWKRSDGCRRYNELFLYVPRKNGKTELAAGMSILLAFADAEPGAEVYCAAADKNQASLVFNAAKAMATKSPALSKHCEPYQYEVRSLDDDGSFLQVISSTPDTKHGFNPHGIVVDELHAQSNGELVDVLTTAGGSRRQSVVIYITTADYDRPSICNTKLKFAKEVVSGVIVEPSFLPVLFYADDDDDWTDPKVWAKANPNLGVSLKPDYMQRQFRKAQAEPTFEHTFRRLHLNQRTQADKKWVSLPAWDACGGPVDLDALRGRPCYGGLDLSTTTDLTAFALFFPPRGEDEAWSLYAHFWCPAENARLREKKDRVPYETWAREGWITLTEGNWIDYSFVRKHIKDLAAKQRIQEVAFDRYSAAQIVQELMSDGLKMADFGQGFVSMSSPTKELERLITAGKIAHGNNPVLRWMIGNVAIDRDAAENVKPTKKRSTGRIDGVVASIMALGLATAKPIPKESVYRRRGFQGL